MPPAYARPQIVGTRRFLAPELADLNGSAVDAGTAGLSGVSHVSHSEALGLGIRGDGDLGGLCFRYWDPAERQFSRRFVRVKPDTHVAGRKYLQPVGELPKIYFIAGTTTNDLADAGMPVLVTEGEKKSLALDRALRQIGQRGLVIGLGGVWSWRTSPKELQPDGTLGRGRSRPVPDLDLLTWQGRKVYILFDTDVMSNWKVETAEKALATELSRRGARVFVARLPEVA